MKELDYNDQCDLVFGRIQRLAQNKPEILDEGDAGMLARRDLDVTGLGVSGQQVSMAFEMAIAIRNRERQHADSIESAWGVIANSLDWSTEGREEWIAAAELWRDTYIVIPTQKVEAGS